MIRKCQKLAVLAVISVSVCVPIAHARELEVVKAEKPRVVSSFQAEPGAGYPFRQNMYRALLLEDGRIIAISIARDKSRQQTMQGRYSTDNGSTWSAPEDLFPFPKEAGGFGLKAGNHARFPRCSTVELPVPFFLRNSDPRVPK